jgi:hypothetical protein
VRRFESWLAFVDAATDTSGHSRSSAAGTGPLDDVARRSRDNDADFHGTSTWQEALELARETTISPVGICAGGTNCSFGFVLDASYDASGDEVDVGRYLDGDPDNMIVYHLQPAPRHGRVVTLQVDVGAEWDIPCAEIRSHGAAAFGLADALRARGLGLDVYVTARMVPPSRRGHDFWQMVVKVQSSEAPFDASRVEFAVTHPAMLRRLGFSLAELETDHIRRLFQFGASLGDGIYGVPQPRRLPDVDVYLPREERLAAHGGAKGWIESQLERIGVTA